METKEINVNPKIAKFVSLIIGIGLIGGAIFAFIQGNRLSQVCTEKATATVVSMREDFATEADSDGFRYLYYPVIEYQANGSTVKGEIADGSNPPAYSINDTVEILYNPDKTDEFIIAGSNQNFTWIILGALGIICIGVSIYLFIKK